MCGTQSNRKGFTDEVRAKCLLWCERHCCLCGRNCGLDIELHHLDPGLPPAKVDLMDNAMPVCYQCHAEIERSKRPGPRGNSYRLDELRQRRDQVYEDHTRHRVPPIEMEPLSPGKDDEHQSAYSRLEHVVFRIANPQGGLPVHVRTR